MPATVAECEINTAEWNEAIARAAGGSVWEDETEGFVHVGRGITYWHHMAAC